MLDYLVSEVMVRAVRKQSYRQRKRHFLVQTIEIFEKWQLPLLRKSVIDIARTYMLELGKKINPTTQLNEWFTSFMPRHRALKLVKCENLGKARSVSWTPQVISQYTYYSNKV